MGGASLDRPGFDLEPTVITNVVADKPIATQKLFGSVASVYEVDTVEDAIVLANNIQFGLGAYVFSADVKRAQEVADRIGSDMVWINQPTWTTAELPFGGVKRLGIGASSRRWGFMSSPTRVCPFGGTCWGPSSMKWRRSTVWDQFMCIRDVAVGADVTLIQVADLADL